MKGGKWSMVLAGAAVVGLVATVSARQDDSLVGQIWKASQSGVRGKSLQAQDVNDYTIRALNPSGVAVAVMASDEVGDGVVGVLDRGSVVRAGMGVGSASAGQVFARSTSGTTAFVVDGNLGFISGPADMAELFRATTPETPKGSVLVIDPEHPGALRVSDKAYDRRVAGVAAGANDFRPGITLGAFRRGPDAVSVTLSGTVYCLATNSNGEIHAGDLLTTSAENGHAMKVQKPERAQGAILGKAMQDLKGERGLILVRASLQ